ncbi:MAG TPA: hypothetical protein VIN07_01190 [Flavipsychrobacter sp.]
MNRSIMIAVHGLAFSTLLLSCKKAENPLVPATQEEKTKITINTPYENQVFAKGDTVFIKAFATCTTEMHGCKVYIVRGTTDTLFAKARHMHGMEMMVSEQWVNDLETPSELQIIVSAVIDHDGGTADKTLNFKTQ